MSAAPINSTTAAPTSVGARAATNGHVVLPVEARLPASEAVRSTPARAPTPPTPMVRNPPRGPTPVLLSAVEFKRALERERALADRGTRRFCLLVLRRRPDAAHEQTPHRDPLHALAAHACVRLRSTDLVGRIDTNRIEILLSETEPSGATVVLAWLESLEAQFELECVRTLFVYPTVGDVHRGGDLRSNRLGDDGHAHWPRNDAPGMNGSAVSASSVRAADLWSQLSAPVSRWKRALDVTVSAAALFVLAPLLGAIALAIRTDTPGDVIFRQVRAGRGGRPFTFYKFRSMTADAEQRRAELEANNEQDGPIFKMRLDPRVTRVGKVLRRFSLDELPQLWNVLIGDISLVGPRSPMLDEVGQYERWQLRRLSVIGGITCSWQVSGRSGIGFQDWMRLDMRYVASHDMWLDLWLLARTLPAVLAGRGAC